jgi:hypothetical protein
LVVWQFYWLHTHTHTHLYMCKLWTNGKTQTNGKDANRYYYEWGWRTCSYIVMHACAQFMAESMQSFLMHKQAVAFAVLPTKTVHTSLLLGVRGRLRSMPLHSHAIVAMSRSTAESMHAAVMHVPRSRRRACMPLSCMCHVRVREHACCCHACAQFEAESMHAGVMHVPRSRRENMHADVMHVPRSSRRACNCCCHTCATFESESMQLLLSYMCPV